MTFNPNDGTRTSIIVNYDSGRVPDYLLVCSDATTINSRWYVIEAVRTREGQYQLSLLRDVICDYYENVVSAPCFIEKATLPISNSLIYNNEDFSFSQIKEKEIQIDDASHTPWYALYINKDLAGTELNFSSGRIVPDIVVSDLDQYEYYDYQGTNTYKAEFSNLAYTTTIYSQNWFTGFPPFVSKDGVTIETENATITMCFDGTTAPCSPLIAGTWRTDLNIPYALTDGAGLTGNAWTKPGQYRWYNPAQNYAMGAADFQGKLYDTYPALTYPNLFRNLAAEYLGIQNNPNVYQTENGKIIKVSNTNKFYKVVMQKIDKPVKETTIAKETTPYQHLMTVLEKLGPGTVEGNSPFSIQYAATEYQFSFVELSEGTATIKLPTTREHCKNEVYDIIMFPAKSIAVLRDGTLYRTDERFNADILTQLMLTIPKEMLYDAQILPYCPIADGRFYQEPTSKEVVLELSASAFAENQDYSLITIGNKSFFMYYPSTASFTKSLRRADLQVTVPADAALFKLENESHLYRLCSPNYNGAFDFSAAKNRGILGYNITCNYRPYSPYIKVAPIFRGLYGGDFGDARGLICGGDFSISQISDAFASYELQNKNFQNIFDRQIKHMEENNNIQHRLDKLNAGVGALTGGVGVGVSAGFLTANPLIGIGAGLMGAAISGAAGAQDVSLNQQMREMALDYTKDQFGYQLGNIKALPYNLSKVSSRNADNKIFPFLEVYGPTEAEKEAYLNKLKWNGMTVMAIGTVGEHLQSKPTYIKGKIIRFSKLPEEYHTANLIADELNKGVFI